MYRKLSAADFTGSEQRTQKAAGKKREEEEEEEKEEEDEEEGWIFGNRFAPEGGGRDPFVVACNGTRGGRGTREDRLSNASLS